MKDVQDLLARRIAANEIELQQALTVLEIASLDEELGETGAAARAKAARAKVAEIKQQITTRQAALQEQQRRDTAAHEAQMAELRSAAIIRANAYLAAQLDLAGEIDGHVKVLVALMARARHQGEQAFDAARPYLGHRVMDWWQNPDIAASVLGCLTVYGAIGEEFLPAIYIGERNLVRSAKREVFERMTSIRNLTTEQVPA